ncbi:hypothetical protein BC939DRAFT_275951 [Gamsiella multidivaricata]|uniref:uncharacterized protein n=1 Tax=Gamsiella multidivaricata TaxID=101098 RepID=UPI00221FB4E4|nr:uncharacterized protein BC939DRAFT_275951 [Gamsiella multidivaricata]KAI7818843.1 hypothetical protein BC939DRAFT_275951 [Gamsiella multidivaricata]
MKQLAGTEASLEPEQDFTKIDIDKLKAFQEEHQLSELNPTSGVLERDLEDITMEEPELMVKQESTTPTVMTPSESAVVVPDLSSGSPMEIIETEHMEEKDTNQKESTVKMESTPSIPGLGSAKPSVHDDNNPPSPKSRAGSPESNSAAQNDRQMTPEPRTPGSTPGSTPGAQSNSGETSPSRKIKRVLPPPERMVTRGVSGAIRHRSVDEILGTASERSPTTQAPRHPYQDRSSPVATSPGGSSGAVVTTLSTSSTNGSLNVTTGDFAAATPGTVSISSAPSKPPALMLQSTKKHAQPTTAPPAMKRSESRHGLSRYDFIDGTPTRSSKERHADLYAWQLRAQSQPIYKSLQTASKALTTKDWKVAREELKLMRAMQRIEALKAGNRWSFKQIKKHRGPARTKTHWDHLLDEMRWMQADFREERRWKIVTAYEVSRWVMAWHETDNKSLVCVPRRKVIEVQKDQSPLPPESSSEAMEEAIKMEDLVHESMMDASEPAQEESLAPAAENSTKQDKDDLTADTIKIEVEDTIMTLPAEAEENSSITASKPTTSEMMSTTGESAAVDSKMLVPALKENAKDDVIMPPPIAPALLQKTKSLLLELDPSAIFFPFEPLESLMEGLHIESLDVDTLFQDFPLYGPPDPDDKDAYVDEAEHGRVTMISRLMSSKAPVSLEFGPLASQIVFVKRKREPITEMDDFDEEDARVPKIEGKISTAIPGTEPPRTVPVLFQTKKNKDPPMTPIRRPAPPGPLAPKTPVVWTSEEDDLLTTLIKPYQYNWDLVSDLFNSMRGPIAPSERRTPWDCYERWAKKEGPLSIGNGTGGDTASGLIPIGNLPAGSASTPPSPKARKDKDGKRMSINTKTEPSRKRPLAFSLTLLETMKKASKKREIALNRVNAGRCLF